MTYFVSYQCIGCKNTDCTLPCPTAAFANGKNCLFINPDLCIDCGACVDQCPVNAIIASSDVRHVIDKDYKDLSIEKKAIKFFYELNQEYGYKWPAFDEGLHQSVDKSRAIPFPLEESLQKFAENLSEDELKKYSEKVFEVFQLKLSEIV